LIIGTTRALPARRVDDSICNGRLVRVARTSDIVDAASLTRLASAPEQQSRAVSRARRPRRVVFINRYFYPDVSATSQILFDLARRLVEHGIEVHVVCSRQLYDDPMARLAGHDTAYGIHVHRSWTCRFGRDRLLGRALDYASFYVTGAAKLLALLRRQDVVVAKTDPPLISIFAAAVARLRGARLVNWLQDVFPEVASHLGANPLPSWLDSGLKKLRDRSLATAQANVVLGDRMREHLLSRSIQSGQIRVIENWADGDAIVPKPADACELRQRLGLAGKFVVAYSGNLGRAHEYETLLAAAERLRSHEDIVFLMIGGGAKMQQLQRAVEEKMLASFRFLPYQPRELLSDSLCAADVHLACLLPQLEGLIVPSKFYGILAAGRPVVFIGDLEGELARIIRGANCGAAAQVGDVAALVNVLLDLKAEPAMRDAMGLLARELFVRKYTVARATQQWIDVLTELDLPRASASEPVLVAGP
jgi:colanic acid biosynthesis glycosyl transferase WcaI